MIPHRGMESIVAITMPRKGLPYSSMSEGAPRTTDRRVSVVAYIQSDLSPVADGLPPLRNVQRRCHGPFDGRSMVWQERGRSHLPAPPPNSFYVAGSEPVASAWERLAASAATGRAGNDPDDR